jgi:hypothetical protein
MTGNLPGALKVKSSVPCPRAVDRGRGGAWLVVRATLHPLSAFRNEPDTKSRYVATMKLSTRLTAGAVLSSRIAYGIALAAAPERMATKWIGAPAAQPNGQVPLRGLGVREVTLHGAAIVALIRGEPMRPWFLASVIGDLSDIAATVVARNDVPPRAVLLTALTGGGAAALTIAVLRNLDA